MKKTKKSVKKEVLTLDEIEKIVTEKEIVFVEQWGKSVEISGLPLTILQGFKESGQRTEEETQAILLQYCVGFSEDKAKEIAKTNNGSRFAPLIEAISRAFSVTDEKVKKP